MVQARPKQLTSLEWISQQAAAFRKNAYENSLKGVLSKHFQFGPDKPIEDKPYYLDDKQARSFGFNVPDTWKMKAYQEKTDYGSDINFRLVNEKGWEVIDDTTVLSPKGEQYSWKDMEKWEDAAKLESGFFKPIEQQAAEIPDDTRFDVMEAYKTDELSPGGLAKYDIKAAIDSGDPNIDRQFLIDFTGDEELVDRAIRGPIGLIWDTETGQYVQATMDLQVTKDFYERHPELLPAGVKATYTPEEFEAVILEQEQQLTHLTSAFEKVFPSVFEFAPETGKVDIATNFLNAVLTDDEVQKTFIDDIREIGRTVDTERLLKAAGANDEDIDIFFPGEEPPPDPEVEAQKNLWNTFYLGLREAGHGSAGFFTEVLPNILFPPKGADQPERWPGDTAEQRAAIRQKFAVLNTTNNLKFEDFLKKNPQLQPPAETTEFIESVEELPFLERIGAYIKNPEAAAYSFVRGAPPTLAALAAFTGVTALTKNPMAGAAASFSTFAPMQIQDVSQDLINAGASPEQAYELATVVGAFIAGLDVVGELPLLKTISPAIGVFKKGLQKELVKRTVAQMVKRGITTFTTAEFSEVFTEVAQQVTQDYTVSFFDKERNPFENISQTAVQTLIQVTPFALFGGAVATQSVGKYKGKKLNAIYTEKIKEFEAEGLTNKEARVKALSFMTQLEEAAEKVKDTYDSIEAETFVETAEPTTEPTEAGVTPEAVTLEPISEGSIEHNLIYKGEVVGSVSYGDMEGMGIDGILISDIEVSESARRLGVASQALDKIFDEAGGKPVYSGTLKPDGVKWLEGLEKQGVIKLEQTDQPLLGSKISKVEAPTTEPGQPEAGLQAGMMEVPDKEVRPKGKGKVVQISMEDQLKLEEARAI